MAWFLCTISSTSKSNWQKCKDANMWGIATSTGFASNDVARKGDSLLFWLSGIGFVGYSNVTETTRRPKEASETPWLGGADKYGLVIPMKLVKEIHPPLKLKFIDGRQEKTGILQPYFQRGFMPINDSAANVVIEMVNEKS